MNPYKTQDNIDLLYGRQRGNCVGCENHYRAKDMHVDHITPRAAGGGNDLGNLQLLCGHCNSTKGTGTMAELRKRLEAQAASRTRCLSLVLCRRQSVASVAAGSSAARRAREGVPGRTSSGRNTTAELPAATRGARAGTSAPIPRHAPLRCVAVPAGRERPPVHRVQGRNE